MSPDLPDAGRTAFLLDLDGTLIDIAPRPDLVVVPRELPATLARVRDRAAGALAIVSGRPIAEIDALLGPGFAAAGQHGAELRAAPGAPLSHPDLPAPDPAWLEGAADLAAAHPGAHLERKRHGFVLHFREAPSHGAALRRGLENLLAGAPGFTLLAAKMAWEIRPEAAHKGAAVEALMRQPPFAGRSPLYVGDDVTDEDGIVAALALGGRGLRVDSDFGAPAGVRAWLAAIAA